jgi:hypothetical protein
LRNIFFFFSFFFFSFLFFSFLFFSFLFFSSVWVTHPRKPCIRCKICDLQSQKKHWLPHSAHALHQRSAKHVALVNKFAQLVAAQAQVSHKNESMTVASPSHHAAGEAAYEPMDIQPEPMEMDCVVVPLTVSEEDPLAREPTPVPAPSSPFNDANPAQSMMNFERWLNDQDESEASCSPRSDQAAFGGDDRFDEGFDNDFENLANYDALLATLKDNAPAEYDDDNDLLPCEEFLARLQREGLI